MHQLKEIIRLQETNYKGKRSYRSKIGTIKKTVILKIELEVQEGKMKLLKKQTGSLTHDYERWILIDKER